MLNPMNSMYNGASNSFRPILINELKKCGLIPRRVAQYHVKAPLRRMILKELHEAGLTNNDINRILSSRYIQSSPIPLAGLAQSMSVLNQPLYLGHSQPRQGFKTVRSQLYKGLRGKPADSKTSTESKFLNDVMDLHNKKPALQRQLLEAYRHGMSEAIATLKKGNQKESQFSVYARRILLLLIIVGFGYTIKNVFVFANRTGRTGISNEKYEVTDRVKVTFDDVKGCDEAKKELEDVVEFLRNPGRFNSIGARLPKGVLLTGKPGVGKTLLARAVAGEAKVPFFHAAGSEFDELFVGTGAARIRKLFEEAKSRAPCVVFIDEIDAVSSRRTQSPTHPYANQTINQLLSELDGFRPSSGIIVLGATNRRQALDPAVVRPGRFDMEVMVQVPDYNGRKEIFELYVSKIKSASIDVGSLAFGTIGFSGADIENLVNQAAIIAGLQNVDEVTMDHMWKARDKMLMGPARSRLLDDETNKNTAYHEAGHALVAHFTPDAKPVHKITLIPRGSALGVTSFIPDKEMYNETCSSLKAQMDVSMGGRVAEELIFGTENVTTGAHSDFRNATSIAETMVKEFGMSEAVGTRVFSNDKASMSEATRQLVDTEVKRLLSESYERARKILTTHSKAHKAIAEALLKYETISREDMEDIIKGRKPKVAIERERKEKEEKESKPSSGTGISTIINLLGGGDKENKSEQVVKPVPGETDSR